MGFRGLPHWDPLAGISLMGTLVSAGAMAPLRLPGSPLRLKELPLWIRYRSTQCAGRGYSNHRHHQVTAPSRLASKQGLVLGPRSAFSSTPPEVMLHPLSTQSTSVRGFLATTHLPAPPLVLS